MYGYKVYNFFVLVPAIEPISIERFPDYVRDMLQNKESKLKTEFMVSFMSTHNMLMICALLHIYVQIMHVYEQMCTSLKVYAYVGGMIIFYPFL